MKYMFHQINIFILFIIISLSEVLSLLDFTYPSAISLINGNVFIIEKKGIYVYDGQLQNIIFNYPFQESEEINLDNLSKVVIKTKKNYIICLINSKIYLFDYEGKIVLEQKIIFENIYNPNLTPIVFNNEDNNYYYVVEYLISSGSSYKLKLLFYKINLFEKSNNLITPNANR